MASFFSLASVSSAAPSSSGVFEKFLGSYLASSSSSNELEAFKSLFSIAPVPRHALSLYPNSIPVEFRTVLNSGNPKEAKGRKEDLKKAEVFILKQLGDLKRVKEVDLDLLSSC